VNEPWTESVREPIWGFDISGHQGPNVDFKQLKREGYEFCFIKASEGIGWWDRQYKTNTIRAREAGLQAGAYHFLWGNDPARQVQTFLNRVGNPEGKMLAVDVETYHGQIPPLKKHLWGFLRELTRRVGKDTPIVVYSGDWYYVHRIGNPQFSELEREGIKVAVWSTPDSGYVEGPGYGSELYRQVPQSEWAPGSGFGGKNVDILQFTAEGRAAGIYPLDINAFARTHDDLRRLVFPPTRVAKGPDDDLPRDLEERLVGLHMPTPNFAERVGILTLPSGRIVLEPGPQHDPGSGPYVEEHPTHYRFTAGVRHLAEKYINMPKYRGKVWANTYVDHPPGWGLDAVSVDFWDWSGRGHALADAVHADLYRTIQNDPEPPLIRWSISNGWMWTPNGFQPAPPGPPGSDAGHWKHIHVTFRGSQGSSC
jgi:GH25 family lysozyme M1 (1,4-beta-N-acetylmuramidase)